MDFGRAFRFITEDPDWLKKLAITGLIAFIPVIGAIALLGWMLEITRRVITDDSQPLPGWENFSSLLTNGLKAYVVTFAYALPIFLLSVCAQLTIPLMTTAGDQEQIGLIISLFAFCLSCMVILFSLVLAFIIPAAFASLAASGEIKDAFNFNHVFALIRSAMGAYLLTIVGGMAAGFISSAGAFLCFVGIIITAPFGLAVQGHLYGQAYKAAKTAQSLNAELQ